MDTILRQDLRGDSRIPKRAFLHMFGTTVAYKSTDLEKVTFCLLNAM